MADDNKKNILEEIETKAYIYVVEEIEFSKTTPDFFFSRTFNSCTDVKDTHLKRSFILFNSKTSTRVGSEELQRTTRCFEAEVLSVVYGIFECSKDKHVCSASCKHLLLFLLVWES